MDLSTITKKYSNGEVTVVWKPGQCSHSTICWKQATGLPEVFDPKNRPWINPNACSTETIIEQVKKCPSGALSYFLEEAKTEVKKEENPEKSLKATAENITKIEIVANGPYLLNGIFEITDNQGKKHEAGQSCALCRCGGSANKPFCDGTHVKIGFNSTI